ncbi:MAG: S1 RNA-binding domain-containing protein, partial [Inquilinus sp.]|nr:S1 RNA-binding domain-containing protein [Inquilinus sp.]
GGVTRFGLFVTLTESGADALVPISTLPDDYYEHDNRNHALIGPRWGRTYRLGATVRVRLVEADPITGSTLVSLIDGEDGAEVPWLPGAPAGQKRRGPPRPAAGKGTKRGAAPKRSAAKRGGAPKKAKGRGKR